MATDQLTALHAALACWPAATGGGAVSHDQGTAGCLPSPPAMVHAARAYPTLRYAAEVDAFLWEGREHPMPDLDAIDAVNAASDHTQSGGGDLPKPTEAAAAAVVLEAVRLSPDQAEARPPNTAQTCGVGWVQIAAILDLGVHEPEGRYRAAQTTPGRTGRRDHPSPATTCPMTTGRAAARSSDHG